MSPGEMLAGAFLEPLSMSHYRRLRLQADCDVEVAKAGLAKTLRNIGPWKEAMEAAADAH